MGLDGVGRETNQLYATLGELGLKLCKGTELGGANWGVIFWVGEQDNPLVANELVEVNGALSSLSLEVGCDGSQAEAVNGNVSMSKIRTTRNDTAACLS